MAIANVPRFAFLALFAVLINTCSCFHPKTLNISSIYGQIKDADWAPAGATWYGPPDGDGSDGGACGYGNAVGSAPYNKMVAAGGPSLWNSGKGCGACYQVKCTAHAACSGNPVTVTITDQCPGGPCSAESVHFDLSGAAVAAMAKSGQADQLRAVGNLQVQHKRVPCNYGRNIDFKVDAGSNPNYLATLVEFENGDGDLSAMDVKQANSQWSSMQQSWGAVWKLDAPSALQAPLSIKLTTSTGKTLTAENVIPAGWTAGTTYHSNVNF